jgi:hypothetical protein
MYPTSMVVNHDWGSIHALAGINGGVSSSSPPGSPMDYDCEALVHRINKSIPLYSSNKSNCRVGERNEPRTNVRSNSSVMARAWCHIVQITWVAEISSLSEVAQGPTPIEHQQFTYTHQSIIHQNHRSLYKCTFNNPFYE